ncbi:hypothetical protein ACWC19_22085, partial [Streptomyces sp. 900105245]
MRPLSVPARLAAAVLTVAAAAGCVSVGDDAGPARPSHSAGQHGGGAPNGGPGGGPGGFGYDGGAGDGKHGHGGKAKHGKSASASATPSGTAGTTTAPAKPGKTVKPGDPVQLDVLRRVPQRQMRQRRLHPQRLVDHVVP